MSTTITKLEDCQTERDLAVFKFGYSPYWGLSHAINFIALLQSQTAVVRSFYISQQRA